MPNATSIGHRQELARIGYVSNVTSTVERYLHLGNNTSAPAPQPHINQPSAPDQSISSMDVVSKPSHEWDLPQIQAYIEKMENDERDLVTRACDSPIPDQAELLAKIQARNDNAPPPTTPCNPAAAAPAASGERPAYSAFRGSRPSTPDQNVRFDVPSSSSSGGSEPTYAVDHRAVAAPTVNRLSGWTLEAAQPRSLRPELRTGLCGDDAEHPFQILLRKHHMPPPPPPPSPTASNAIDELKNPATTTEYRYLAQEGSWRGLPQNAAVQWVSNSIPEYPPSETGGPVSELSHKFQDDVDSMDEKTFAIHTLENRLSELQNRIDLCRDPERKKRMREIQDDLLSLMAEVIRSEAW
ncbi:hypothetical protein I317_00134 [Kwoniella heveanensis CBS 569]|nr:hypothetical protein I317_00134 [Kwoniella heveanensis CBS 569]